MTAKRVTATALHLTPCLTGTVLSGAPSADAERERERGGGREGRDRVRDRERGTEGEREGGRDGEGGEKQSER